MTNIHLPDHKLCCGCGGCVNICPRNCLSLIQNKRGELQYHRDASSCINCQKCESVCPILNHCSPSKVNKVYAFISNDKDVVQKSSSGGAFSELAKTVLSKGGVIFGASFAADLSVCHNMISTVEELDSLRRSKYTQSNMGKCYKECELLLKQNREVLFAGTPCQIKALKLFLKRSYNNLTTVSFVCHGTPPAGIFHDYLKELAKINDIPLEQLAPINFRDKSYKSEYAFSFSNGKTANPTVESPQRNLFLKAFLCDTTLSQCCFSCPARNFQMASDYILADFWSVQHVLPDFADSEEFASLIYVCKDSLNIAHNYKQHRMKEVEFCKVKNPFLYFSPRKTFENKAFFREYLVQKVDLMNLLSRYSILSNKTNFLNRIYGKLRKLIIRIFY